MTDETTRPESLPEASLRLKPISRRATLAGGAAALLGPALAGAARAAERAAPGAAPARSAGFRQAPEVPWEKVERAGHPPAEPGRDYRPVVTPNGTTLDWKLVDGVKVFHLVAEPIVHELAQGLTVRCWGYNGRTPGPTIEAVVGDRVRIYVTNRLPAPTSVHWHGMILPCGMDGVSALTQPAIQPGETCVYEFVLPTAGTLMYHPHFDGMTEEGLGMTGMFVIHPRASRQPPPDRDFCIMLHEWMVETGTSRPDPNEMVDFNLLTMNGRAFPDTHPLVAGLGHRVRIRLGNLSQMSHHPIHLHGYAFEVVATDGGEIPPAARWPETTVLVPVGSTRDVELVADNPGDWLMHCHMTHHTMNQMGHGIPNMVGAEVGELEQKIRRLVPGYVSMGEAGMGEMAHHRHPVPGNSIPMRGFAGQFGAGIMGGMATMLKVREGDPGLEDPGPYTFPAGTVSPLATAEQMAADGIDPGAPPDHVPVPGHAHGGGRTLS